MNFRTVAVIARQVFAGRSLAHVLTLTALNNTTAAVTATSTAPADASHGQQAAAATADSSSTEHNRQSSVRIRRARVLRYPRLNG